MSEATRSENLGTSAGDHRLVTRVVIRNYRSIAHCDVRLGSLTFLVGPNGSGKGNLLDAFGFVSESLRNSIEAALDRRGGFYGVCRSDGTETGEFGITLECNIGHLTAHYSFTVGLVEHRAEISSETCRVLERELSSNMHFYHLEHGKVISSNIKHPTVACRDQLFLSIVSAMDQFRPVYDALSGVKIYRIDPKSMRMPSRLDAARILERDGANIARVICELENKMPYAKDLIDRYMRIISPGTHRVDYITAPTDSKSLSLQFSEAFANSSHRILNARQVSSGTLMCLGLLTALLQNSERGGSSTPFIGIEGAGDGLHQRALAAVLECVKCTSEFSQVIVSTHSTDLLDDKEILAESILAVAKTFQGTEVGPVSKGAQSAIRDRLFTAGELLRSNALHLHSEVNPSIDEPLDSITRREGSTSRSCK